ncbi:S4 domain-containing protein [Parabacteroides sp. AD58]|uniref:S4 domain-containing protein n=1 Tax=Parabacteroides absconsus TaxID=2951805 RepID=A0ABZ2IPL8_9BACT|nr:S4 domain-containing protein [Parabacteroides sp. AD58]MCM6903609.1 S4 domain-containing protein [Parabacteroides sp. AD58]
MEEIRLNKLMSDSGLCSRREADKFIEMGRVTVNGKQPQIGQKVTENDEVLVDGEPIRVGKYTSSGTIRAATRKIENLVMGPKENRPKGSRSGKPVNRTSGPTSAASGNEGNGGRREHYAKYNKYAAARHAAKERETQGGKPQVDKDKALREALQPKFGKSLSRSAVAQRMAASPKSASLRKTSRNNPVNKAKRIAKRKGEA